jgi:hypothetical protein
MSGKPWSAEGISAGRLRVTLRDPDRIAECVDSFGGQTIHLAASSPVHVVEWKWPLTLGVAPGEGSVALAQAIARTRSDGPEWRQCTTRIEPSAVSDILLFADGPNARASLDRAPVPMSADLLVLCCIARTGWPEVARQAENLLALTQSHAILAVSEPSTRLDWFWSFVMELTHNVAVDEAAARVHGPEVALWSTREFIEKAVLEEFIKPLSKRIKASNMPLSLNMARLPRWSGRLAAKLGARKAIEILKHDAVFSAESEGASLISEMARAAALPPEPEEVLVSSLDDDSGAEESISFELAVEPVAMPEAEEGVGGDEMATPVAGFDAAVVAPAPAAKKAAKPVGRYLQPKVTALQQTRLKPEQALEAGKPYLVTVNIGPLAKGRLSGGQAMPEPPVAPEDAGVMLAVVFTERNSSPAGELKTVFLPRTGTSSECGFEFVASAAARVFEGWISVYHNNRLLHEGVLRSEVVGGADSGEEVPSKPEFVLGASPRPLSLGVDGQAPAAGTVRLEASGALTAVQGVNAASVQLTGLKPAVDALSAEFDQIEWDTLHDWSKNKKAAERLSRIAQLGWQMWREVSSNPITERIVEGAGPLVVHAADAGIRAPLELCYDLPQPKSTASICKGAAEALRSGQDCGNCEAKQQSRDVVCPLGFWGMRRVIEWHGESAEKRGGDTVEITNEPVRGRNRLAPLDKVLRAQSAIVKGKDSKKLEASLKKNAPRRLLVAADWDAWARLVKMESPTMLLLMPHVDHNRMPPAMEIQDDFKDPPGIDTTDVVGPAPQSPLVLLLGCGAAHASVDFMSLPAQFRRSRAAYVIAPIAELYAGDAPEIARAFIECVAAGKGRARPAGEVLLETKRRLLGEGRLAGLMLLAAGDANWLIEG